MTDPGKVIFQSADAFPRDAVAWEAVVEDRLSRYSQRGLPSYLVDCGGRVLRANDATPQHPAHGLAVHAGRLCCHTRADQARLDHALAKAATSLGAAAYVRLSPPPDIATLLALVAPLAAAGRRAAGLALVALVDAGARARAASRSLAMLSHSFALTAREAEVAALISTGADIAEVARRLGLANGTARNYLKSVMQKLEVHSQVELAALVAELTHLAEA